MGVREWMGLEPERKVRYAIVGLGYIAQEDMMPGFEHTENWEITALLTSDPGKAVMKHRSQVEEKALQTYAYWNGLWKR
jgi:predicted dehydrogenase